MITSISLKIIYIYIYIYIYTLSLRSYVYVVCYVKVNLFGVACCMHFRVDTAVYREDGGTRFHRKKMLHGDMTLEAVSRL